MKSIKPGRGPSMMGAVGAMGAAIFGVFWTIMAISMGAPGLFAAFGVIFVIMGIGQAIYNYTNATGKNRFSEFDITDDGEEKDPLNEFFAKQSSPENWEVRTQIKPGTEGEPGTTETTGTKRTEAVGFCPYCGAEVQEGFEFCAKCGKQLP